MPNIAEEAASACSSAQWRRMYCISMQAGNIEKFSGEKKG